MTNPFDFGQAAKGLEHFGGALASTTGDLAGDGLDALGLHGAARDVRVAGSKAGYALGNDTPELELGQTNDPKQLVHGDPAALRSTASKLEKFSVAFGQGAAGLKQIDTGHWEGAAAEAFRAKFSSQPGKWASAAEAMGRASAALESCAGYVEKAQASAQQAIDLWWRGQEATAHAEDAYNQEVSRYNTAAAANTPGLVKPAPFTDPGDSLRAEAQRVLTGARNARAREDFRVDGELLEAGALAPAGPSAWAKLADMAKIDLLTANSVGAGELEGVAGIAKLAAGSPLNPMTDAWDAEHPGEAVAGMNAQLAGVAGAVLNPGKLVKGVVGSGWGSDPAQAFGKLLPTVALATATGGGGAAADGASAAADLSEGTAASADVASSAEAGSNADAGTSAASQSADQAHTVGDPVNVATGEVTFAQPDVVLPGLLPLVIERTHQSGRRGGRWLGAQWTSTLDQRLLLTSEKIAGVFGDGRTLFWRKPGPEEDAALPVAGPAWPLRRTGDGAYEVTDRQQGLTWRFEWQPGFGRVGEDLGEMPLKSVTDRAGHEIAFAYTEDGAPEVITHSGGYRIAVAVDGGRVTGLSLGGVRLVSYEYDESGDLAGVVNSSGQPLRFGYDAEGRMTDWTDRTGHSYQYSYDEEGRCAAGASPSGAQSARFRYEPGRTFWTNATGEMTEYELDQALQVTAITDPLGQVTRFEYDERGRRTAVTDALGNVTRYAYDEPGNLVTITRPDGGAARAEYDDGCLPVLVTGPDGGEWRRSFDGRGNPVELTAPDGAVTRYAYDERGHLAKVTAPGELVTEVTCDAAGQLVEVLGRGEWTRYDRDQFGRITRITGPLNVLADLTWTVEGRLASRTLPVGTESWEWDADGREIRHVSPSGSVTSREYGPFDVVTAVNGPDGRRTEFAYDAELRLESVTQSGLTWRYEYDPAGRMISETDFNGAKTLYRNGSTGLRRSRVTATGQKTSYEYDALGNLVSRTTGGATSTFEYDPAGRLTGAKNASAEIRLSRDRAGRVTSESCNGRSVTTMYDHAGRVAGRTTPSGAMTQWAYDTFGRPEGMVTGGRTLSFCYHGSGRESVRELPGGARLAQLWDAAGRLACQRVLGAGDDVLQQRSYAYDRDGFVTGTEDVLAGSRAFGLDAAGRVTSVTGPGWQERYAYDGAGNVVSATWPAAPRDRGTPWLEAGPQGSRAAHGTLITEAGVFAYRHDDAGRVVARTRGAAPDRQESWRYQWDAENRLVAVATPDGGKWRYSYDPLGRRVAKQRLGSDGTVLGETRFAWDGLTLAEQAETAGDREEVTTWDYRPGTFTPLTQSVNRFSGERGFWAIITDLTGTPCEMVGADGALAGCQRHTLWGSTAWQPGGARTPLRFPGQYADDETGLHYNNQRYYDPVTGAYLTPDPLGLAPSPNPHAYVPNPHVLIDPLGLTPAAAAWNGTQLPDHVSLDLLDGSNRVQHYPGGSSVQDWDLRPGESITAHGGTFTVQGGRISLNELMPFVEKQGPAWEGTNMDIVQTPFGLSLGALLVG